MAVHADPQGQVESLVVLSTDAHHLCGSRSAECPHGFPAALAWDARTSQ